MPFWWRRRKKNWWGKFRYRRRYRPYKARRRRRRFTRRRNRRPTRRRRRRKVRRKRKQIYIKQWQPESIVKCKIIGFSTIVLGAEGTQYLCYTNEAKEYTQPKAPGGGGFGSETISLDWLYLQHEAHNNIWTRSNKYKDLVRYFGGTFYFYRHDTVDFIVRYSIQPPFNIDKLTYPGIQPQNMLLSPHHRVILSKASKPTGKRVVKIRFKPVKQMISKWFFQKQFADYPLILLQACAATLRYPNISCQAQNTMVTLYYLDTVFFPFPNWAKQIDEPWMPQATRTSYKFFYKTTAGDKSLEINKNGFGSGLAGYMASINKQTGWFRKEILNSYKVESPPGTQIANRPIYVARYNPYEDTGDRNEVYVVSILQNKWTAPTISHDYYIRGQPLWMALHGFYSFLKYITKDKKFEDHYMFVLKSPAIHPVSQVTPQEYYPIVDKSFIDSTLPWDEYISENIAKFWYPKAIYQQVTINALVESGPFIPKLGNLKDSTWELLYKYKFNFKWGGPQVFDPTVDDPTDKPTYTVPDTLKETVAIADPKKQAAETLFHEWDYRRGFITETALKRMSENIETDSSLYPDGTEPQKKRRKVSKEMCWPPHKEEKIQSCLRSLCEEDTCQEDPQTLEQLIQQQKLQQQQLKHNILELLTHLKKQQRYLSLQTGVLE
nr:MAG: ORF1 [Torque teno midi virus]